MQAHQIEADVAQQEEENENKEKAKDHAESNQVKTNHPTPPDLTDTLANDDLDDIEYPQEKNCSLEEEEDIFTSVSLSSSPEEPKQYFDTTYSPNDDSPMPPCIDTSSSSSVSKVKEEDDDIVSDLYISKELMDKLMNRLNEINEADDEAIFFVPSSGSEECASLISPSASIDAYLRKIEAYIERLATEDKNLNPFREALNNLYNELKADIDKQKQKGIALEAIQHSAAFKVTQHTADLLNRLEELNAVIDFDLEEHKNRQKEAFANYKKRCQQSSRFGAFAKAVATVCLTGICCVISGALGFTLGCVVGSVAGPAGAVTVGAMAIPKSAAIGATAGTAVGTALGFGSGSWMSWMGWRLFQPRTVQLAQKMTDAAKKVYR